jgi:hypothetical protein
MTNIRNSVPIHEQTNLKHPPTDKTSKPQQNLGHTHNKYKYCDKITIMNQEIDDQVLGY